MTVDVILLMLCLSTYALMLYEKHFYLKQIQTLVDKLRSSSFESYARAQNPEPKVKLESEPPEDLRPLQEFSIQL